jgi:hypothetical protein
MHCGISGLALIHPCNVGTTLHAAEAAQSGPIASKCKSRKSVLVIPTWSIQAAHQSLRCSVELRWIRPPHRHKTRCGNPSTFDYLVESYLRCS